MEVHESLSLQALFSDNLLKIEALSIGLQRVALFHDTQSNDSRSSDAQFRHKLCLSLHAITD